MSHKSRGYSSNLSDQQWQHLERVLPKPSKRGRPIELEMRAAINAMLYLVVTGCQWLNLPREFLNPKSVFYHFRKWCLDGTWQRINRILVWLERRRGGRFARPIAGILDSQSVKTTSSGTQRGYDGHKKVKGRKRHVLSDTLGHLLEVVVTATNSTDVAGAKAVLSKVEHQTTQCLLKVWADHAYQGAFQEWLADLFGIELDIVTAPPDQVGFAVQPRRWVVERTFAWLSHFRRLSKDYERCPSRSEGVIYLASIRTLLKRLTN